MPKLSEIFNRYRDIMDRYQVKRDEFGRIILDLPEPEDQPIREQVTPERTEDDYYTQQYEREYPWMTGRPKPVDEYGDYIPPKRMGYRPKERYFRGIPRIPDLNENMWGFPWYGDPEYDKYMIPPIGNRENMDEDSILRFLRKFEYPL